MRKKICLVIITILVVTALPAFAEKAKGPEVSGSVSVDVMSNYVWRGQRLSEKFAVQPSVGITYNGYGANLWSNWDSDYSGGNNGEVSETDLTLNYTFSIDKLSLDVGYIYYGLEAATDTQEIYVSAGYDTLLSPALTIYYDYEEGEGAFIVASIGHSLSLSEGISLDLGASAGYNARNKIMGTDEDSNYFNGFYNGEVSASVSIPVTDAVSVAPVIAYTFPLSNDAENAIKAADAGGDNEDEIIYGGVSISLNF